MTIPVWAIPTALTVLIWGWAIVMPMDGPRGDYDFGPALSAMFRLVVCVVGTLAFWLVYFMAKSLA